MDTQVPTAHTCTHGHTAHLGIWHPWAHRHTVPLAHLGIHMAFLAHMGTRSTHAAHRHMDAQGYMQACTDTWCV